jgi:serine protease 16
VSLEHRYYGLSVPTDDILPDYSTPNMRFLSSHQALADISFFLSSHFFPMFNLTVGLTPVVTFGGSYPGVLSALARLRLPHLVHAAIASSAPVQNQMDYSGYNDVVGRSLRNTYVGGGGSCFANFSAAFDAVAAAFQGDAATRHAMASKLKNCGGLDGRNDTGFALSEYSNIFKSIVQGNLQWWMPWSIQQLCANFSGAGADEQPVDVLASFISYYIQKEYNGQCYSTSYDGEKGGW